MMKDLFSSAVSTGEVLLYDSLKRLRTEPESFKNLESVMITDRDIRSL